MTSPTAGAPVRTVVDRRTVLVNSTVAAVLGSGLMVLVHELTHLFTGLALGVPGKLFPFGVQHDPATDPQNAIMAISAPVFSLVSGFLLSLWLPFRARGGFAHLLWLWFAFASMMEGIGYLVITPFGAGDTANTVRFLHWPGWVAFVFCAVGVAGQFWLARHFAPHVGRSTGADHRARLAFTLWPWAIGTSVNLALSAVYLSLSAMQLTAGDIVAITVAGSATLVFAPMALIFRRLIDQQPFQPLRLRPVPVAGLIGVLTLIVVNFCLHWGLRVG